MRIFFIVFLLFTIALNCKAQVVYNFEVSNETYEQLGPGEILNPGEIWDDINASISLGFDFLLFDKTVNTLFLTDEFLGCMLQANPENNVNEPILYLAAYECDLMDRGALNGVQSLSPIKYFTEGSTGNRIFKMQWKNVGFNSELVQLGTMNDFVNFQIWLYEADGKIEYRYGENNINDIFVDFDGETGPLIGIADLSVSEPLLLLGDPENPTINSSPFGTQTLDAPPSNGIVYSFTPQSVSNVEVFDYSLYLFPNPAQRFINFENEDVKKVKIFNNNGNLIKSATVNSNRVDIEDLNMGFYIVEAQTFSDKKVVGKFFKH